MAEQTIVFAQGIEMPPDIPDQARQLKPADFTLQMLPPSVSATERAATPIDSVMASEVFGLMTCIFIRSLPFG